MKQLYETYKSLQEIRVKLEQQIHALKSKDNEMQLVNIRTRIFKQISKTEHTIYAYMKANLAYEPIWTEWLERVEGVGVVTASAIVSYLTPISKFETVSKLWRYCGYACIDGKAEKPIKGQKLKYNPRLKTLLWLLGESFVKTKGFYRKVYEQVREEYNRKWQTPEDCKSPICRVVGRCTDSHKFEASKRKVIKIFLAHYFAVARDLAGLPVQMPYVIEYVKGHEHYIEPPYYRLSKWQVEGV